jgi:hypothetical protein
VATKIIVRGWAVARNAIPFVAVHTYALLGPALGLARGGYADFHQRILRLLC